MGSGAPEAVRSTSPVSALTQVLALPLVIPIQQRLDRVVTSVAEVELRVQIKGKSYTSKMARYLENGDREYGVSEAFNSAFDYLVYDIENGLTQ